MRRARDQIRATGWLGILGARLIPLVPFLAISLAAGLLRLPLRGYLAGTGLGIVPGCLFMTLLGRGLISEDARILFATVFLAVGLAILLVALKWRARGAPLAPPANPP